MGACMLALVTDAWGGRGGIAQYNRDLLGAIASAVDLRILPRHAPEPPHGQPDAVSQAPARPGRWSYAIAAIREALRHRTDIVFCGHLYMAPLAALLARFSGARLVVQTHGIEAWPRPSGWVRWATEQADLVLAVSRYTRAQVLSWAAIDPERVAVLPNTVSERFTPGDRVVARRRFGLGDQRVLLTVGRLAVSERYKGHDRVIAALPALVAAGHDVLYLIGGDGDDRRRLEAMVRATGVAERVRFLGAVPDTDLVDLYRAADLFVMPSTGEGFGIAFLEAMACGTPALGLAIKGDRDALAPMLWNRRSTDVWAEPGRTQDHVAESSPSGAGHGDQMAWLSLARAMLSEARTSSDAEWHAIGAAVAERFGASGFRRRARAVIQRHLLGERA